ncbi:hypothetical protein SAMN05216598_2857 [Pseudomonas asplenii]|uniref:Uncharacterized protein n=1 Tax=Pseudomonas asplenii TaxID=53407 RepID=A0A1H1V8T0_9PSED|nr:hypothetical protein SAMN05216598_2857 [Pseudomonas asplenii]
MTARTLKLYGYLLGVSLCETPLLKRLRDDTQALPNGARPVVQVVCIAAVTRSIT